jgi:glutaminyl-tRNA synthetase
MSESLEHTNQEKNISPASSNFIREIMLEDLKNNKNDGKIQTRFPPEPNGYLHIGHLMALVADFGLAEEMGGKCNLRFDDTNPDAEEQEYVDNIIEDIHWMGYDYEDRLFYASDYFEKLYQFAEQLIIDGKAYVDDLSAEEMREYRGTLTEPGKESPFRERSVEENLDLFRRMKAGEFAEGSRTLRAKINMKSGNMNMRDPVIYRIKTAPHHRSGTTWNIYPMYDYQHPLSDAIEGVTHSMCSLEYVDHNELYRWFIDNVKWQTSQQDPIPYQYEWSRLNITGTIMSKRKLRKLVEGGYVQGWDDPRMPTICGLRRRGYTPSSLKDFINRTGISRSPKTVDAALLEHCIREELNATAHRVMAVLHPLKLIITNYPENSEELLEIENNPEDPNAGSRQVPFAREIYIEQEDFMEDPPKKFHRLRPGGEIRLKGAYIIQCNEVIKNDLGEIIELQCSYDPETKSGGPQSGRKVKGTSHWVSAKHATAVTVRLYDTLFTKDNPEETEEGQEFTDFINPDSLQVITNCMVEPRVAEAKSGERFQFLRQGYFYVDHVDFAKGKLVFNRTVGLKDAWARQRS